MLESVGHKYHDENVIKFTSLTAGGRISWCYTEFCCFLLFLIYPGGHYIAYCQNVINGQWYEFDDQYVTEVHETVVQNAEAYVLFYR